MSEAKDPGIKLFGKTIQLPDIAPAAPDSRGCASVQSVGDDSSIQDPPCSSNSLSEERYLSRSREEQEQHKDLSVGKPDDGKEEDTAQTSRSEQLMDSNAVPPENDNSKETNVNSDAAAVESLKSEEEQSGTSTSQEKILKKPDKILPCPRCNSMDTKFCYFNNYNVNQPRHFCKNCQRYWTAGGTMRNVPVGAGRRKNKNSATHYRSITVPETFQNVRADLPNGVTHHTLKANGTVLTFGSDTPLCESMATVLNIAESTMRNTRNGFHKPEEQGIPIPYSSVNNGEDQSSGSSVSAACSKDEVGKTSLPELQMQHSHSFPPQAQMPCFPGAPWPYTLSSVQWSSAVPPPNFCPPGFPMPFYPAPPYWNCTVPSAWHIPWVASPTTQSHKSPSSGPNSPTLGKHSRDDSTLKTASSEALQSQKESNPEKCLWVPKTLRIDDPGDAAKSSIWATLGIKHDKIDSGGGGLFKAFQPKDDERTPVSEASTVLRANPAALSRSLNFHESS